MQFCTNAARHESELGAIRSLYLSLNAPVIAIDELPVGPARAGVALRVLSSGGLHLQIAIRSLRSGEVVAVASDLGPESRIEEVAAVEAALSYAEGMGFLFDEDEIADPEDREADAADKAAALWCDLVEEVPERARTRVSVPPPSPSDTEVYDLVRDVPIEESVSGVESIAVEIDRPGEPIVAGTPGSLLSKFRIALAGNAAGRAEPLGEPARNSRIRLLGRY